MNHYQPNDVVYANRTIISENVGGIKGNSKVNAEKGDALKVLQVSTRAPYPYRVTRYVTDAEPFWVSSHEINGLPLDQEGI